MAGGIEMGTSSSAQPCRFSPPDGQDSGRSLPERASSAYAWAEQLCRWPAAIVEALEATRNVALQLEQSVPLTFGGYDWEMQPRGIGRYHFRLDHPLAVLGITATSRLPTFRVQARAEALHSPPGPDGITRWIESATSNEGLDTRWTVGRIDLHADRGAFGRARSGPTKGDAWELPLTGFAKLDEPITLEELRTAESQLRA